MSKTRIKIKQITKEVTRDEAESAFAQLAVADAKKQELTSKMDGEIAKIREKYADKINECEETIEEQKPVLEAFALQHPELFDKKKSLEMSHGKIGFRTGMPKLKPMKGWTWSAITDMVKEKLNKYLRVSEEVNKEALLADRNDLVVQQAMKECHIEVVQDEPFFIEPKKELVTA